MLVISKTQLILLSLKQMLIHFAYGSITCVILVLRPLDWKVKSNHWNGQGSLQGDNFREGE